ncbi:MAG: DNA polymerase III subunit beta [Symploca sp. SIO2E9]|nr:DNA polymerase III subunit beta [Symploca sp. SIO2E9]
MPKTTGSSTTTKQQSKTKRTTKSTSKRTSKATPESTEKTVSRKPESQLRSQLRVTCDQSTLNDYLDFISKAVPHNPTHAILSNVLLVADETKQILKLSTYNLEFGMQASFESTVSKSGQMTLPSALLQQMVRKFPHGQLTIECLISENDDGAEPALNALLFAADTERFEIMGMVADEFPELPRVNNKLITLPASLLISQLKGSLFAASSNDTKRILNSSHFMLNQDAERGLDTFKTWTTDGHRMALMAGAEMSKQQPLVESARFTIPVKVLRELERNLNPTDQVTLYYEGDNNSGTVIFEWNEKRLVTRTIEGQYPDCTALIEPWKEQYCREFITERLALLLALERLAVLSDKSVKTVSVKLDGTKQKIHLTIEHKEVGNGKVSLDAQINGDDLTIKFDVRYFIDVVKAISSSNIRVSIASVCIPTLITPYGTTAQGEAPIDAEYILAPLH